MLLGSSLFFSCSWFFCWVIIIIAICIGVIAAYLLILFIANLLS